jgi:hypothetical protein
MLGSRKKQYVNFSDLYRICYFRRQYNVPLYTMKSASLPKHIKRNINIPNKVTINNDWQTILCAELVIYFESTNYEYSYCILVKSVVVLFCLDKLNGTLIVLRYQQKEVPDKSEELF